MNEGVTPKPHLPPGQIETKRFPAVGERVPSTDLSDPSRWEMAINGLVDAPPVITLDQFLSRADQILTFDIHCVTRFRKRTSPDHEVWSKNRRPTWWAREFGLRPTQLLPKVLRQ